jgi:hypothetical protein
MKRMHHSRKAAMRILRRTPSVYLTQAGEEKFQMGWLAPVPGKIWADAAIFFVVAQHAVPPQGDGLTELKSSSRRRLRSELGRA